MRLFGSRLTVLGALCANGVHAAPQKAALLTTMQIPNPAFVKFLTTGPTAHPELIVSSFSMLSGTRISRVNLTKLGDQPIASEDITVMNQNLIWPNEITPVPESILGPDYVAVSTGFLVPGRSTGAVALVQLSTGEALELTTPKKGWFYHRTYFEDMNGDGRLDIVTARGTKPIMSDGQGELVWLEQPSKNPTDTWSEHLIANGPDVYFRLLDLDHDGHKEIVAAEFFSKKLSLHWREGKNWTSRTIDDSLGAAFDLAPSDLNGDGHLDLVVTNHEGKDQGAVYAYEIPSNFKEAPWPRHTLLSGIRTELRGINQASPGSPLIWNQRQGKPHILAAGDGSTKVHWLVPRSEAATDWTYEEHILLDTDSTIGSMSLGDAHDDGSVDLFVPAYDRSQIHVLRMVEP